MTIGVAIAPRETAGGDGVGAVPHDRATQLAARPRSPACRRNESLPHDGA
jgi:hypothetical protein